MSDIIDKAQATLEIVEDSSLPAWQRVSPALSELSGLTFSDLAPAKKQEFERQLAPVNVILADHRIETLDAYERLSNSAAADILSRIQAAVRLCFESEAERIMSELDSAGRKLPVEAIKEVRAHRDILVPYLIASLENAMSTVRDRKELDEEASFFAVFLLVEMEIEEAYPVLLDLFRLPGTLTEQVLGDGAHDLAGSILAVCSRGDISIIDEIIADRNIDMFQRWSVMHTYINLVRDKTIDRQQAINSLLHQLQVCIRDDDHDLITPLVCELGDLAAEDALETIRVAFERGLVDESVVSLESIESEIASPSETLDRTFGNCCPTGISDTIDDLSWWASFREEPSHPGKPPEISSVVPRPHFTLRDHATTGPGTIRVGAKVGRNDPCPCGSGKKYK
ncbi:MAG: DUF1186 domain-containing protein, partial [Planctomycetales bacterium]|nr:DUF1186 domain-containing protein [Planctomycetales bacterium]